MKYKTLGYRLPNAIAKPLFGDRLKYGKIIQEQDNDWIKWQQLYLEFYTKTQKEGIGNLVNLAGYNILKTICLDQKKVLEIGPGLLPHSFLWEGQFPEVYHIVDVKDEFVRASENKLKQIGIDTCGHIITGPQIPVVADSIDIVISFYNLEHLNPLSTYLDEIKRILRPGGILVGAIPCEGGLAWGLGRFLTTRKYVKKKGINYDKIIAWEHPNFADQILMEMEQRFERNTTLFWPLAIPCIDMNLVCMFAYQK